MSNTAIPSCKTGNAEIDRFAAAAKQSLESLTGQQKNSTKLVPLASTATLPELIAALNVMIARAGQ